MKRGLLIEDDDGVANWLSTMLRGAGVNVTVAGSLASARAVRDNNLDFVLLDLLLPDSEGFATVERVQEMFPELPVVVVSGSVDEVLAKKSLACGVVGVLNKSTMTGRSLMEAVEIAAQKKSLGRYGKIREGIEAVKQEARSFRISAGI